MFADSPRRDRWHLDEMVVRIAGRQMYPWRAVDQEGEIFDLLTQPRRGRANCSACTALRPELAVTVRCAPVPPHSAPAVMSKGCGPTIAPRTRTKPWVNAPELRQTPGWSLTLRWSKPDSNPRSLLPPDRSSCDMGMPQEVKRTVRADGRHLFQYPLRSIKDRVVDKLAVELDRCTTHGFRLGEHRNDPFGVGDLRLARREDPVHGRDLLRVNAHLALKAKAQRGASGDFEPLFVREIDPNRVERRLDVGGARGGGDPRARKGQLRLCAAPRHAHVEGKITRTKRDMPDARAGCEDCVEVAEATRRLDDRDQIDSPLRLRGDAECGGP